MIYGGKLSKACEPCRIRRAKCDLIQPECTQCLRAKRSCHGYRDTEGLRINDMSELIKKKFRVRSPKGVKSHRCIPPPPCKNRGAPQHFSTLTHPIEDRAFLYFHATFVAGKSRPFKYLDEFYQQGYMSTHLSLCIRAVSLACLSKTARSTVLENQARRVYVLALHSVNAILASLDLAKNDGTMSAIMLLDQFEKLIPPSNRSTKAWSNHLAGAATLMKLRGTDQFMTKIGLEMFAQMSSHFFVTCMEHEIPLPADFLSLRIFAANFVDNTNLMWRLTEITISYIAFRAAVRNGSLFDSTAIISTASQLEDEVARLLVDLPPEWSHQTVELASESNLVFESHYDIYADYQIADALNSIRAGRIALLDIIIDEGRKVELTLQDYFFTLKLSPSCKEMVQKAEQSLLVTTSVICATVPQLAGYLPHLVENTQSTDPPSPSDFKLSVSNTASAYTLLWPVFAVGNSPHTSKLTRAWVTDQLRRIGRYLNLEKSSELADILESGVRLDIWKAYGSIGTICYLT